MITAIMIANTEPDWVKNLSFGGIPKMIDHDPKAFDANAITDDNCTLAFERKTATDFLNSLKEDRLFPQLTRLALTRIEQERMDVQPTYFPYLIITGQFLPGPDGKVTADGRATGWSFEKIMGTILSIQEMGVFVVFANGDLDYQDCILRIGRRNRNPEMRILAPRPARMLGPKFDFLTGIPDVGIETTQKLLEWSDNNVAHILTGITDMEIKAPMPLNVRRRFRDLLGLQEGENLVINGTNGTEPVKGELGKDYQLKEMN